MSITQAAVLMGRVFAESLMVDACTISRKTGESINAETLESVPTTAQQYSGVCRLTMPGTVARDSESGSRVLIEQQLMLSLPIATSGSVRVNDVVTITSSENDPTLVGRTFRIAGGHHQSQATARRFPVTEVTQ